MNLDPRARDSSQVRLIRAGVFNNTEIAMRRTTFPLLSLALGLGALFPWIASADDDHGREIVTVAFGAGLNTAQPGNSANHHVIPDTIRISAGDVISFNVAGLHAIRVYANGVKLRDVKANIPQECQVNPPQASCAGLGGTVVPTVFYAGLNAIPLVTPPNPAPPPPPPFVAPSVAVNRIESVTFPEPGRYLVICAVLEHFNDAMMAWIDVRPRGKGNGHDDHDGHHD
jgi:plastocyanin